MKEPIYKQVQEYTNKGYERYKVAYNNYEYRKDGVFHREGAPAIRYPDGEEQWWFEGKYHNTKGPALIYPRSKEEYYYLHGVLVPEDEFNKVLNAPLKELPLYINTPYEPLVKRRLLNERINL